MARVILLKFDDWRQFSRFSHERFIVTQLQRICVIATVLVTAVGCADEAPPTTIQERVISFGQPSLTHVADDAKPEALNAYRNVKRFVSDGSVDFSSFDLMKPEISHWCPPQDEYHDWLVSFPITNSDSEATGRLSIAVLNDGQCWVWPRPVSVGGNENSQHR
jgi:hypothetical protein